MNTEIQKIALPDKNGLVFYEAKNIVRCQSENSYTDFFLIDELSNTKSLIKVTVSKGFDNYADFLISKGCFYRVHNQHIINIRHIARYTKNNGGYLVMRNQSDAMIPVARARKEGFLNYLKIQGVIL